MIVVTVWIPCEGNAVEQMMNGPQAGYGNKRNCATPAARARTYDSFACHMTLHGVLINRSWLVLPKPSYFTGRTPWASRAREPLRV